MSRTLRETRPRGVRRRWASAAAILVVMLASASWGFLVRERHVFPYRLARRAEAALKHRHGRARSHAMPGRQPRENAAPPEGTPGSSVSLEAIDRVANLPYLQGYRSASGGGGIRVHDPVLSEDGLNFFTSRHAAVATLMDMDGRVVKTWTASAARAFPGSPPTKPPGRPQFFRDAALLPDGGIIGLFDEMGLVRLDARSRPLWAWPGRTHHDIDVDESGNVWGILHESRLVAQFRDDEPVLDDFVVEISPQGKPLKRLSLIDCFQRSSYAPMLDALKPSPGSGDIFHANSVDVLDGSLAGRSPAFRRGNVLVSLKLLDAVAIVDPDAGRIVWALTGQWHAQHSAHLLANGRVLLFDNFGTMRMASRALEMDPLTQEILWSYGGRPQEDLMSTTAGWVQRLAGGNTLITESNSGRVIEVTRDKKVVWEFVNPNRVGKKAQMVAVVNALDRVPRDLPFLEPRSHKPPQAAGATDGAKSNEISRVGK